MRDLARSARLDRPSARIGAGIRARRALRDGAADASRPFVARRLGPVRSGYATCSREKQKVRNHYGVSERTLLAYVRRATRAAGPTGENLLRVLERRLDNVVFRLGLAPTIPAARQLVVHRHILVNGRCVSMPSHEVKTGDVIAVRAQSRTHPRIVEAVRAGPALAIPDWLERDPTRFGGRVVGAPDRSDVPFDVDEKLIVEYYAR